MKTTFVIKGTHCHSCKSLIEDVCKDIGGVKSCTVDFKTGKAVIEHVNDFDFKNLKKEIESLGKYTVNLPNTK